MRLPMDVRIWLVVVGLAIVGMPTVAPALDPSGEIAELSKEKREKLKGYISQGRKAYDDGQFEKSLEAFQKALEILEHPEFVYRTALAHQRLGHDRKALEAYRRYLEMAPESEDRGKVERTIEMLEKRIEKQQPTLEITSTPEGVNVRVGEESEPRGTTPLTLEMEPGTYKLHLTKSGYQEVDRTVDLSEGKTVSIQVDLEERPETTGSGESEGRAADSTGSLGPWITMGVGGALAGGSLVSYLQFDQFRGRVEQARKTTDRPEPSDFGDKASTAKTWEAVTWALGAGAVAAAGAGAVWMVVDGGAESEKTAKSTRSPRLVPVIGPEQVGLQLRVGGP